MSSMPRARPIALIGAVAISAAISSASLTAQTLSGVTLLAPLPTSASAPGGPSDFDVTSAGPIGPAPSLWQGSQVEGAGLQDDAFASFSVSVAGPQATFSVAANSRVPQGSATVGPFDVQIDWTFPAAPLAQFEIIVDSASFSGSVSQNFSVDVDADGSVDHVVTPVQFDPACASSPACNGAADPVLVSANPSTTISVRVTGTAVAVNESFASFNVTLRLSPEPQCSTMEVAPRCIGLGPNTLLDGATFDGGTRFLLVAQNLGLPPAMIFGFSNSPITLPLGGCILTPSVDIVAPMMIQSDFQSELVVPRILSGLPLTYYAQAVSVDFNGTGVLTSRALQVTCP